LRSFVAVRAPNTWVAGIAALCERLNRTAVGLRWIQAEGAHVTLAFLGQIARARVPAITVKLGEAARACTPCLVNTGGLGVFPHPGRAAVLWLGVQDPSDGLGKLQRLVVNALSDKGLTPEARVFHPHVTLGRWRTPPPRSIVDALLAAPLPAELAGAGGAWTVTQMDLMESRLTPQGSVYTVLKMLPLKGTASS
jgi:2'-5' RNA ligase